MYFLKYAFVLNLLFCLVPEQQWGSMMLYKSIECPCLHIKNFVVTYGSKKKTFSKWSELPIRFPAFDYTQHADLLVEDSEEEDMDVD